MVDTITVTGSQVSAVSVTATVTTITPVAVGQSVLAIEDIAKPIDLSAGNGIRRSSSTDRSGLESLGCASSQPRAVGRGELAALSLTA